MYLLPGLDVTGNCPLWLVAIFPVTSIAFMKLTWVLMEGVLVGGVEDCTCLVDLTFFGLARDGPWPWPGTWGGSC